ncbi:MAG TPA: RHS repeat-associated core domain-containing protein [Longimicrobium sp.]|nr:RHS repeat-associated core domain-containing protein [Longimicrobium sp.]
MTRDPPEGSPPPRFSSTYAVQVTPDGGDSLRVGTGAYVTIPFTVTNTGTTPASFIISPYCVAVSVNVCEATVDTMALAAGESRQAGVTFQAVSTAGAVGNMTLTVWRVGDPSVTDNGYRGVRVVAPGSLSAASWTRATLDRGDCAVAALGGGGVSECGDLRLAHALPPTRTLNQARAPVLLYNSQHAYPHTIHATLVTNTQGAPWDSVRAEVRRGGQVMASGRWPGWADTQPHRIALGFAETGVPLFSGAAGVFSDTLLVRVKQGGAWSDLSALPIRHVVVDRRASVFGTGWWLAGLEQLTPLSATEVLWVGGDGSARIYQQVAPGRYASAEPDGPDTLVAQTVTLYDGGTEQGYARKLPGKGEVGYRASGQHLYTRNRLGHTTWFFHDATGRMVQVALPTAVDRDTSRSYYFAYTGTAGTLSQVLAPHAGVLYDRKTWIFGSGTTGAIRVTQIVDHPTAGNGESSATQYAYDALGRDTLVIAPGGTPTRFGYAWNRLAQGATTASSNGRADTIYVHITPQQVLGLPAGDGSAAAPSVMLNTGVDGPLPGNADLFLYYADAAGRLIQLNTPQGITRMRREDPRYPGLVTSTVAPSGYRVTAGYDARGHLSSQTEWNPLGDGRDATTLYAWNDQWDEIAGVTSPTGITQTFGYDARGLREWEQVGPDTARRVRYGYNARGQVATVRSVSAKMRGEAPEAIAYDTLGTGNVVSIASPLGIRTQTYSDRIGRDTLTVAPVDSLQTSNGNAGPIRAFSRTSYDVAGRVLETASWGESQWYWMQMDGGGKWTPAMTQRTRNSYDAAGRLWKVARWSEPDSAGVDTVTTRWEYDGFGRKTAEIAPDDYRDRFFYDAAGRDTLIINRRGEPIRTRYDVMGHVLSRAMQGDSSTFDYNAVTGEMLGAYNASARIRRSYYPNGLLKGDTLQVAWADGGMLSGEHVYGMRFDYDREGRRAALTLPGDLRPSATQTQIRYAYDPVTGAPQRITDPLGNAYEFFYRADGAVDSLALPGGAFETRRYDADGRLTVRRRQGDQIGTHYLDSLRYDLRGKVREAVALSGTARMTYDALGHLVHSYSTEWSGTRVPYSEEAYAFDGLGNTLWHRRSAWTSDVASMQTVYPTVEYYEPRTGRHQHTVHAPNTATVGVARREEAHRLYDHAGNLQSADETGTVDISYGVPANSSGSHPQNRSLYAVPPDASAVLGSGDHASDAIQHIGTTYTYRPDGKLTQVQRAADCIFSLSFGSCVARAPAYLQQRRNEAYRYDALGRRVWVRAATVSDPAMQNGGCVYRCDNTTRRTVWDGDQVLAEIRYPNSGPEQDAGLDADNVAARAGRDAHGPTAENNPYGGRNTSDWAQHGRVLYVHGEGMDQPLGLVRMDYSYDFPDAIAIVPHASWRGTYEAASFADGGHCTTVFLPYGEVVYEDSTGKKANPAIVTNEEGVEQDTTQERCVEIDFPGKIQGMTRFLRQQTAYGPISWMGSLMQDAQDASGLMFRRNRYYDAASGRFTQEDPIGLAGGLNAYGFAEGDPVTFTDPMGLCPPVGDCVANIWNSRYTLGDMKHLLKHLIGATFLRNRSDRQHSLDVINGSIRVVRQANTLLDRRRGRYNGDQQNGFRHIFGSCQLTRDFGEREAREITSAHEEHFSANSPIERDSHADQKNNNIGHRAGSDPARRTKTCEEIADENVVSGNFWRADEF